MQDIEKQKYWIWYSLIKGVGSIRKQKLLEKYKTPEKIYNLKKEELLKTNGIGEELAQNILNQNIKNSLEIHINYMQKNNIDIVNIQDKEYPQMLKEIYSPPISYI